MKQETRFELKYQLSLFEYQKIKCALAGFTDFDKYTMATPRKMYPVRSLYFDTFNYNAYVEKITGENNRVKLRLRSYYKTKDSSPFVNVELKTRRGLNIIKHSARVSTGEYDYFIKRRRWSDNKVGVLIDFERLVLLNDLKPNLLVDYYREAHVPKDKSDVRITFDHSMRFAKSSLLFSKSLFFRSKDIKVIMEIKTKGEGPQWLQHIVRSYGLKAVPNSKYAIGIEQTQNALFI
tara:strand:+ start:294 stop:998 length:705 start_codon:yes stop_codon:yes gene_type:complete